MSNSLSQFWRSFDAEDFVQAQQIFATLDSNNQQAVFSELFQKSAFHRQPFILTAHRAEVNNNQSFDDFHQAWLPTEKMCNKVGAGGQMFQQHFPIPVRAINAVNINNSTDILTIASLWVKNKEEEQGLFEYLQDLNHGSVKSNEIRHDSVKEVADRELLGMFLVKSDDNLGTPF